MAQASASIQPACWECGDTGQVTVGTYNAATDQVEVHEESCTCR